MPTPSESNKLIKSCRTRHWCTGHLPKASTGESIQTTPFQLSHQAAYQLDRQDSLPSGSLLKPPTSRNMGLVTLAGEVPWRALRGRSFGQG